MKKKPNSKGSVLMDSIMGVGALLILGVLVFQLIFFQVSSINKIRAIDRMNSIAEDEISLITQTKKYIDKSIGDYIIKYKSDYVNNINGIEIKKIIMEIENEKVKIKRVHELVINE